jgi:hypothetical protein
MLTAKQAAALLGISARKSAEVDAYINSPEHLAWERSVLAGWKTGPTGYQLHQAERASKKTARRNATSGKRRAAKLQRTPAWSDQALILAVYERARELTEATGTEHHVDHIYPLQGRLVSGLHVDTNLQILTGPDNCRKNNRYEP